MPACARAQDAAEPAPALRLAALDESAREDDGHALAQIRRAVERARFDEAHGLASALLARPRLSARTRNDALELLAIAQVAAREDDAAGATLRELFARDPEHPERLRDPGPAVEAAFSQMRRGRGPPRAVPLTSTVVRDTLGRAVVVVQLGPGGDAVDTVHVFTTPAPEVEPTHLVAEVGTRDLVTLALPAPPRGSDALTLYVEARAPSGSVLGGEGSRDEPLRAALPALETCREGTAKPIRRAWWLWTSVAIVIAGVGVAGAVTAH